MTRPAATIPPPLDRQTVLAKARRILWALQHDPATAGGIDRQAALAVTAHRHELEGQWFAAGILERLGPGADSAAIDAAIRTALQGGRR